MENIHSANSPRKNPSDEIAFWMQELQARLPFTLNQNQLQLLQEFLEQVLASDIPIPAGLRRRATILTLDLTETQHTEVLKKQQYQGQDYDLTRWNIAKKLSGNSGSHEFIVEPMIIRRIPKMF